jgi:hypothetical protein
MSTASWKAKHRLFGPFSAVSKNALKLIRRVRKVSTRQVSDRLPAATKQWQWLRYRTRRMLPRAAQSNLRYPDFVILGAPKCGSSWLQGLLRQHPRILMVPDEIEYFSMHSDYPIEWYAEHFARCLPATAGETREAYLLGERSARYCAIAPENIHFFHDILPKTRLILMARDPVSRHWAHAKKYFAKRRLRNSDQAVLDIPRAKLFDFFREIRPLGEFSKIIAKWTAIYPSQQLLVLSQEGTLVAPRATLDAVLRHLGLSVDYDPAAFTLLARQRNSGPVVEMPEDVAEFLVDMFADERQWLQKFFSDRSFSYAEEQRA